MRKEKKTYRKADKEEKSATTLKDDIHKTAVSVAMPLVLSTLKLKTIRNHSYLSKTLFTTQANNLVSLARSSQFGLLLDCDSRFSR